MANSKELIVFVPGMMSKPEVQLDRLTQGFDLYCRNRGLPAAQIENNPNTRGTGQRRITIELANDDEKTFDLREAYWWDLAPTLSAKGEGFQKILAGLVLLISYFSAFGAWRRVARSKWLTFCSIITVALMLAWYYGVLATAFTAIGASHTETAHTEASPPGASPTLEADPKPVTAWFKLVGAWMGSWWVWGIVLVIMPLFRVSETVDLSYAAYQYLHDSLTRQQIGGRIGQQLARVRDDYQSNREGYSKITVVAFSFGVVAATDVLAHYQAPKGPKLHFVTLGSLLTLATAQSPRVDQVMQTLLANDLIQSWWDFYSPYDWFCDRSPIDPALSSKYQARELTTTSPFLQQLSGATHLSYFSEEEVFIHLLGGELNAAVETP